MKPVAPAWAARPYFSRRWMLRPKAAGLRLVDITILPFSRAGVAKSFGVPSPTKTTSPSRPSFGVDGDCTREIVGIVCFCGLIISSLAVPRAHPVYSTGSMCASRPYSLNFLRMKSLALRSLGVPPKRLPKLHSATSFSYEIGEFQMSPIIDRSISLESLYMAVH